MDEFMKRGPFFAPDIINKKLVSGGSADLSETSEVFEIGNAQGGIAVKLWAEGIGKSTSTGKNYVVGIQTAKTSDGVYTTVASKTVSAAETASTDGTYAVAGGDLLTYIPVSDQERYAKVTLTAAKEISGITVKGNLDWVAR